MMNVPFFSCISFARIRLLLNLQSAGNIKLIYVLEKKNVSLEIVSFFRDKIKG